LFSSVGLGVQGSVDVSKLCVKWVIGKLVQNFSFKSYFHYSVAVNKRFQSLSRYVVLIMASALSNRTFKPVAFTVLKLDAACPRG
jgi:hypothetical protein